MNTTEAISRFHERYPGKAGPMPEGSEKPELRARGLNVSGFAGAQSSGGGYCHGLARDHSPSLGQDTSPFLPTVVIGNQDVSMEAHSVQDLEALSGAVLLWDIRDGATAEKARGRLASEVFCVLCSVFALVHGWQWRSHQRVPEFEDCGLEGASAGFCFVLFCSALLLCSWLLYGSALRGDSVYREACVPRV